MWLQVLATLLISLVLVVPTGRYLYHTFTAEDKSGSRALGWMERLVYRAAGVDPDKNMNPREYLTALIMNNAVMALLVYLLLRLQGVLPLNPRGLPGLAPALAFNTVVSFVTNTNLQNYTGEATLSNLSQMAGITFLMFTSAASGLAAAFAFIRGVSGHPLGNYWRDFTRAIIRLLLPAALILSLVLVAQGVPQTLTSEVPAATLEGAVQRIIMGPVASLESIKHIGTNGGGFFGANAAHPYENPTPLTNLLHILAMLWLPTAILYALGLFVNNTRQGWVYLFTASVLFIVLLAMAMDFELVGNPLMHQAGLPGPSMEGKEVRFGIPQSVLFAGVTTAANTGSVNSMHESLTPMGVFAPLVLMMLNAVFGGGGVGLINLVLISMLAVFLVGLMVGRTPEFLRKKLEPREITLIAIVILVHPFLILAPTAISLITQVGRAALTHTGPHGLTQALYEFTSSAANNGSAFAGIHSGTAFWNTATGLVIFFGRYVSIAAALAIAGSLHVKKPVPLGPGTLRTDTALFMGVLIGVIIVVGALTFFPALALGPIAEHLALFGH
jgi:K+-transporting ATPase ATPase A chain